MSLKSKNINWDNVQEAQEFPKVVPGGYVCRITSVEDVEDREYLKIEFDIAEGELTGHYTELYKAKGFWGGSFIRSYKETARPFFKAFKTAVEESNPGYKFNNDESTLIGKYIGLTIGTEEYEAKDGSAKTRQYVDKARSVAAIRSGDFDIPEDKLLKKPSENNGPVPANDVSLADLPFDI